MILGRVEENRADRWAVSGRRRPFRLQSFKFLQVMFVRFTNRIDPVAVGSSWASHLRSDKNRLVRIAFDSIARINLCGHYRYRMTDRLAEQPNGSPGIAFCRREGRQHSDDITIDAAANHQQASISRLVDDC